MRVLLLTDRSFAIRERAMLSRVEVGLAAEGVRVVRAAPPIDGPVETPVVAKSVTYEADTALPRLLRPATAPRIFGVRSDAKRLARRLDDLMDRSGDRPVDVIHAWGEGCWSLALETAWLIGAATAIDVWSLALVRHLRSYERRHIRSAESQSLVWLAPSETLRNAVERARTRWPCRAAPWGVHIAREEAAWSDPSRPISVVVASAGRDPDGLLGALHGLAAALRARPDAMIFLDEAGARGRRLWGTIRTLGLADRLSVIPDMEGRRDLALRADVLIQPDRGAGLRSIVLDAMAAGMTVIARRGDLPDDLIDGDTSILVDGASAAGWTAALERAVASRDEARALGARAREHVREHRPVSGHIRALIESYERMLSASTVRMAAAV